MNLGSIFNNKPKTFLAVLSVTAISGLIIASHQEITSNQAKDELVALRAVMTPQELNTFTPLQQQALEIIRNPDYATNSAAGKILHERMESLKTGHTAELASGNGR